MKMDKRMVSIVSDYTCGLQYGYKIFTENLSLVSTEQIFCLLGERFCFSTPSPLQNPIKNFFKRRILERRKGMPLSLQTLTPAKLHRNEESSDSSYLLLFQSTRELSASLTFPGWNKWEDSLRPLDLCTCFWSFRRKSQRHHWTLIAVKPGGKCFQRELRSPSEAKQNKPLALQISGNDLSWKGINPVGMPIFETSIIVEARTTLDLNIVRNAVIRIILL